MEFDSWKVALGGVAAIGTAIWGAWQRTLRINAQTRTMVAESATIAEIAKAQGLVYTQLRTELDRMHMEIAGLKNALADERNHSLRQDRYIQMLIRLLRDHNIVPPPFESRENFQ